MPLLSISEAAIRVGYSIELLTYLSKKCPKHNETRILPAKKIDEVLHFDEAELLSYQRYLNEPWPIPDGKDRPPMRDAIADDVKAESHFACAICGNSNHGELAHIHPVSDGACNSPDNLIFLCPNHHTEYDYGFKPKANITKEVIVAAKLMKRDSRQRMLRCEANAFKQMRALIKQIKNIMDGLPKEKDAKIREVRSTELKALLSLVTVSSTAASEASSKDEDPGKIELKRIAPSIAALAKGAADAPDEYSLRTTAREVVAASRKVIIDLGEEECPHCSGRGQKGISGSLCTYCGGSCFVSTDEAETYDQGAIDEVECPRCLGRCVTGLVGDICEYCKGDGVVSEDAAEEYDPDDMKEVPCPRCDGKGQVGLGGSACAYCKGSCFVPREKADSFDGDSLDEVECPRCSGSGRTGIAGSTCIYCRGDGFVTAKQDRDYDPDTLSEVVCPHCDGSGRKGRGGELCSYCKGDVYVPRKMAKAYNPDDIDEEMCPRCSGTGQTGWVGDTCKLCNGDTVVSSEIARA